MYACCALLNYMLLRGERVDADSNAVENMAAELEQPMMSGDPEENAAESEEHPQHRHIPVAARGMARHREATVKALWRQYQDYRDINGLGGMRIVMYDCIVWHKTFGTDNAI